MNFIKLSKAAKLLGISKQTLWNRKNDGTIQFIKIGNLNGITQEDFDKLLGVKTQKEDKIVIYCRISSPVNKNNLISQIDRVKSYCIAKGYKIHKIVKEYGSGLNDNRKELTKLLSEQDFTKIVIEHKDRLTRTGFNYLKTLLENQGKQIEVINNSEDDESDIIQDFVSIITSYCARIYGKRRSKRKTELLIKKLQEDEIK